MDKNGGKMEELSVLLKSIGDLDAQAMSAARARQDVLTKPQGSLGVLEQISIRLAGITGLPLPVEYQKTVVVMAGDHGVVEAGVSAFPSEVTAQMVLNFINGGAAINVLARHAGARVVVVDMGVKSDIDDPLVINGKVRRSTANMLEGPAMTTDEAVRAVLTGAGIATGLVDEGTNLLATGDMGIGNTTASSAIVSVLGGLPVDRVVGSGTGLDKEGVAAKAAVIKQALAVNKPDERDPIDVVSKVGGLEIAGLAGLILGAAARRVPVIIDGFISGAAALTAAKLAPKSVNYMFGSHQSIEPGHRLCMAEIGISPMLHMDMRLGEGTGAVLAMNLVEAASRIISEMATFAEAGVSKSDPVETVS